MFQSDSIRVTKDHDGGVGQALVDVLLTHGSGVTQQGLPGGGLIKETLGELMRPCDGSAGVATWWWSRQMSWR